MTTINQFIEADVLHGIPKGTEITAAYLNSLGLPPTIATPFRTVTASASVDQDTDYIILADAANGNLTLQLPSILFMAPGRRFIFKKSDAGVHTVTITPAIGETIDGETEIILTAAGESIELFNASAEWQSQSHSTQNQSSTAQWWTTEANTIARISASQFTVSGDRTAIYTARRALCLTQTTSAYGYVLASSYDSSAGLTTVTVTGCTIDTGLSMVQCGQTVVNAPKWNPALTEPILEAQSTSIASATTTDMATATGNEVHITGTAAITSLGTVQAGATFKLIFDAAATLVHNATSLILPGTANITAAANDAAVMISEGAGNWRCLLYTKADGTALHVAADSSSNSPTVRQAISSAFVDVTTGRNDCLWNGQVDFAQLRDTSDFISSGDFSGQYAYFAFDGSDSTYWQSALQGTAISGYAYIGMKNLKRNIKSVKYLSFSNASYNITSVKLQYSQDGGATWVDIQTAAVSSALSAWTEIAVSTYASGDAGLHSFRILANSNLGSGYSILLPTVIFLFSSNLDVCTTAAAINYDQNASYPAINAFDNTAGTGYASSANMSSGNLYLGQSGLTSAVKAVRMYTDASSAHNAKEVRLSWKQNSGDAWTDIATVALTDNIASLWLTIPVPSYSPAGGHFFAVRPTTNCAAGTWSVWEMEFYTAIDDDISLTASSTDPLITSFASGSNNYENSVTASDTTLLGSSLVAGKTHFVYQERNISTGAITHGKTPIVPQYGPSFDATKHSLLHFDGTNGSTALIDEFGHTWVVNGNGALSTSSPKFGTALIAGTSGLCKNTTLPVYRGEPFTIEGWWYTANNATASQTIVGFPASGSYPAWLFMLNSTTLELALSANGSTWGIGDVTGPVPAIVNNTKYKWIFEWDGYYYRVWWGTTTSDMRLVINIKSATPIYTGVSGLEFGGANSGAAGPLNGGMEECRVTIGSNRYGWSPVAETAAFPKYDADIHWFDLSKKKMFKGNAGTGWTECQQVYLGEAYMDAHGVTDLRNYSLNGEMRFSRGILTASTLFTFNDNIGTLEKSILDINFVNKIPDSGYLPGDRIPLVTTSGGMYSGNLGTTPSFRNRNTFNLSTGTTANSGDMIPRAGGGSAGLTTASWTLEGFIKRRF